MFAEEDEYSKLIEEIGRVSLSVGNKSIGILAVGHPTWAWYVGTMGSVKWMWSGNDLPGRVLKDPVHYSLNNKEVVLDDVKVLLLQGEWNLVEDKLWGMKSLKTILKFGNSDYAVKSIRSKRRKKSSNVPIGWREGGYWISHQSIGGGD